MMLTMANLNKGNGERNATKRMLVQRSVELYVKAMEKRCITSEATELGALRTLQLVLLVVAKIV